MVCAFGAWRLVFLVLSATLLVPSVAGASPVVSVEGGNIVVADGGRRTILTHQHADGDAVLSPDGHSVVFTRGAVADDNTSCAAVAGKQSLMSVDVTSGQVKTLLVARAGPGPESQLCNFLDKQFSSNGKRLYFATPGWETSGALWAYEVGRHRASYLLPSNGFLVLAQCGSPEYRDKLAVSQHRYFAFGGSFDWYWLFDAQGRQQLGPIGETLEMAADRCGMELGKTG